MRFERRPSATRSFALFTAIATLCLVRSTFQIVLPLFVLALLLVVCPASKRAILIGAVLPIALVAGLYLKNWAMFDTPTTSSWTGMNLMEVTYVGLSDRERHDLTSRGIMAPIWLADPFQPLSAYRGLVAPSRHWGIPVLDEPTKPSSGVPNFNNIEYATISKRYLHYFFVLLRRDPDAYARGVWGGLKKAVMPSDDYYFVVQNRSQLEPWARVFDGVILWQPRVHWTNSGPIGTAWAIAVGYLTALAFGAVEMIRLLRRRGGRPVIAFVWLLVAYATFVMTLSEASENQRIRSVTDPLVIVLVAALARSVYRRIRNRGSNAPTVSRAT